MSIKNISLYCATLNTPIGHVHAACFDTAAAFLKMGGSCVHDLVPHWRAEGYTVVPEPNAVLERTLQELGEYFAGLRKSFSVPTALEGTPFQRAVWNQLQQVPYGTTLSYGELAELAGYPNAARAVGSAMAKNPLPILIPCHRVIASNGQLGGYTGGLQIKTFLLNLEREGIQS